MDDEGVAWHLNEGEIDPKYACDHPLPGRRIRPPAGVA
jgi:hypothetical protein